MIRPATLALLLTATAACNQNTAGGNDREAQLEPAPTPAPVMPASQALSGIATSAVKVQTMSSADVAALGGMAGKCEFRLTAVGLPSFIIDRAGDGGAIKLNDKLITLPETAEGVYAEGDLTVSMRLLEEEFYRGRREMEMVVMLPGAKDELGYKGYEVCP